MTPLTTFGLGAGKSQTNFAFASGFDALFDVPPQHCQAEIEGPSMLDIALTKHLPRDAFSR